MHWRSSQSNHKVLSITCRQRSKKFHGWQLVISPCKYPSVSPFISVCLSLSLSLFSLISSPSCLLQCRIGWETILKEQIQSVAPLVQDRQGVRTSVGRADHVKQRRCPQQLREDCSMRTMSLKDGNASVELLSSIHRTLPSIIFLYNIKEVQYCSMYTTVKNMHGISAAAIRYNWPFRSRPRGRASFGCLHFELPTGCGSGYVGSVVLTMRSVNFKPAFYTDPVFGSTIQRN